MSGTIKLVQISDCHLYADSERRGYNQVNPLHSLNRVLQAVASQQPDRVIVTGDISGDHSAESYQHFAHLCASYLDDVPISLIAGNHDDPCLLESMFPHHWLSVTAPIHCGDWYVHGINSHYEGTLGRVDDSELAHIERLIQADPGRHHLLAVHHHPIAVEGWMDSHELVNRQQLTEFVAAQSAIKAVIYGHVHMPIETRRQHCLYLASPSTCWQWQNQAEFGFSDQAPGYRIIMLNADGQVATRVVRVEY